MEHNAEPVVTEVGTIAGRDAIFLDDVVVAYRERRLELRGELNSNLCSQLANTQESWLGYSISFSRVWAFSMVELDLSGYSGLWSFCRILDSKWIDELAQNDCSSKSDSSLKHYVVATYDDVFNIACESFSMSLLPSRKQS